MSLIKKLFSRSDALQALGLKLEPGNHVYLILYNHNQISKEAVQVVCNGLTQGNINAIFLGTSDPIGDLSYVKLEGVSQAAPSPQAPVGE